MSLEKHHPTQVLGRFMRAAGRPKPRPNFCAHHLVQGKGQTRFAYRARIHMHFNDIRINDPDNGAWMPRNKRDKRLLGIHLAGFAPEPVQALKLFRLLDDSGLYSEIFLYSVAVLRFRFLGRFLSYGQI
ncbi:AHH domain-containing protein [Thalassolituus oleivorans]|uniref:AHH domain-containing protein n=1 Tax=Thalassolituus oleivorans TaxID=187493 RepID=UPI003C6FC406